MGAWGLTGWSGLNQSEASSMNCRAVVNGGAKAGRMITRSATTHLSGGEEPFQQAPRFLRLERAPHHADGRRRPEGDDEFHSPLMPPPLEHGPEPDERR